MEPINIFSRLNDRARVARRLRELADLKLDGADDAWTRASVTCEEGKVTFLFDPDYHAAANWSVQMNGMSGYYARLPKTERQEFAVLLPTTFKISLATEFLPDCKPDGDSRLELLFEIARELDGVIFTPSALRDAAGRILYDGDEEDEDPDATWPKVTAEVSIDPNREDPEEAGPPDPPAAERVARRALAMSAVTARGMLDNETDRPDSQENLEDLLAWIEDLGIGDELEPNEWEVLQRPLGRLEPQSQVNAIWRLEGLVVLGWALGRFELPPHDQLVNPNELWTALGLFDRELAGEVLAAAALRPAEEIEVLRARLFAVHWRMRNFDLNQQTLDFAEFARTAWFGPLDITGLPLVDGDLAINGERLDRAEQDAVMTAHSAALERHQAINWLSRGPERYSEACVGT